MRMTEYTNQRKISIAKIFLSTGIPVAECSKRLGFFDSSHFYRTFKKYEGITPKQFLNRTTPKDFDESFLLDEELYWPYLIKHTKRAVKNGADKASLFTVLFSWLDNIIVDRAFCLWTYFIFKVEEPMDIVILWIKTKIKNVRIADIYVWNNLIFLYARISIDFILKCV